MIPNVLRSGSPHALGIFIVYLHRSMIAITKETIEIIVWIFSKVLIVSPPLLVRKMNLTTH